MLDRDYFFEFSGMPQSGKTQIIELVAQFFRDLGMQIEEYHGGSRYSSHHDEPIEDLNFLLACKAAEYLITHQNGKRNHTLYLLDRGVVDRCIFTNALFRQQLVSQADFLRVTNFLTSPKLIQSLDGVFIFTTSPEKALERELKSKLEVPAKAIKSTRGVMNYPFLLDMQIAIKEMYENIRETLPNVQLFDTEANDGKIEETASRVITNMAGKIKLTF